MCGIAGIFGPGCEPAQLKAMVATQHHRGPDGHGVYFSPNAVAALGHNRLSIIDLSSAGHQPMSSGDQNLWISFNGEVYNYLEIRNELSDYPYTSQTDTEVVLAAYERWGVECLEHFLGMFALLIWDEKEQRLFAARDRFGVKPLYYHQRPDGSLLLASEIKALHAAGIPAERDPETWATYLAYGIYDNSERTFWKGIKSLPAGHSLTWHSGQIRLQRWYDVGERTAQEWDQRSIAEVTEEYSALLKESVRLRFRSDVPVGICLSGGLDSSTLLGLVGTLPQSNSVRAYTFITGDENYDELPWVLKMLDRTSNPLTICQIAPDAIPALAESVQEHQDEPFGGLPTLCYARLFEKAREEGVIVLLDGQGMDEQWAGYDYYLAALDNNGRTSTVQGTRETPVRPRCLVPEFRALGETLDGHQPFPDRLRNLQYRDTRYTKIPRALRFNDRVSMRSSTELREPFLDHRLFELALRQPPERKIFAGESKWLLRQMTKSLVPQGIVEAPKRPLQTPQREWLRGPLRRWADECIEDALAITGGAWLDASAVREEWRTFREGQVDNSYFVWQWINLGISARTKLSIVC